MPARIQRHSDILHNTGFWLSLGGLFFFLAPYFVPPRGPNDEGPVICAGIGLISFIVGIPMLISYYSTFKVPAGHALIQSGKGVLLEGWHFGFAPSDPILVAVGRRIVEIPPGDKLIELDTPDDGILGVAITVSYTPDLENHSALKYFQDTAGLDKNIEHRVLAALSSWVQQKPLPGTLKRALSMQREAESYILGKLTGTTSNALIVHNDPTIYLDRGYPANDLGIRIHEVNVVSMRPIKNGTGKADWGEGDDATFNAQNIFKQFHAHADSLSNLRKLKEALLERYPDESDDIEDIYDQVRISMKENRDR